MRETGREDAVLAPTLSPAARRREDNQARGERLDRSAKLDPDDWHVRCPGCRVRIATADRQRRERAKLGAALAPRLELAARAGRGVRLTAAEVAELAGR